MLCNIGYYELCLGRLFVGNYIEIATSSNRYVHVWCVRVCVSCLHVSDIPEKKNIYVCVCVCVAAFR